MKSIEEMTDKFKDIIKMNATFKDKLGMILSSNCDFGGSNGAMLSVNAMPKAIEDISTLHQQAMIEEREKRIKELITNLTDEERMDIFVEYCKYCGTDDRRCQCWNDE